MSGPTSRNNTRQRMPAELKNATQNTMRILPHNVCDFDRRDLTLRNHSTDGWNFLKSHLLAQLAVVAGFQLEACLGLLQHIPHVASLFAPGLTLTQCFRPSTFYAVAQGSADKDPQEWGRSSPAFHSLVSALWPRQVSILCLLWANCPEPRDEYTCLSGRVGKSQG